jgi:lipopolysaccharide exporter
MPTDMDAGQHGARRQLGRRLVNGSAWMIAMRFSIRGIGLVSTVILARILTPADFGIVAMAMLLISFIEVFNDTGQQAALIAHPNPERAHYDSAWTVTVMISAVLTGLVFATAPLAGAYFNDARIVPVMQFLSLRVLLGGFLNIGTIDFRRSLDFAREFRFGLARKIATFITTLTLALIWRNYWALVVGTVVGHVIEVGLSYVVHHYRPRFSLAKVREIWGYSGWLLVQSIGRYFETRVDEVVVAGVVPAAAMGHYTVGAELGALPMTELVEPVGRALFPNYARIAADPQLLCDVYLRVFSAAVTVCACMATGLILVADDFVAVLLGAQWASTAPLLVWFAAAGAVTGVSNTVYAVFNAVGESKHSAKQTWMRVAAYLPAVAWAASTGQLRNFAIARFGVALILAPTYFWRLRRVIPITLGQLAGTLWRPALASALMVGAFAVIDFPAHIAHIALRLFSEVATGAVIFIATQLGLWKVAGSPLSIESAVLELCGFTRARAASHPAA